MMSDLHFIDLPANASDPVSEPTGGNDFEMIVHGMLLPMVGVVGLVNNVLSLLVLRRPMARGSVDCLLIGLTLADAALIACALVVFALPVLATSPTAQEMVASVALWAYPVGMIAQTASVYFTVLITVERYFVACCPLRAKSVFTPCTTKRCVAAVCGVAVTFNIPRFFEFSVSEETSEVVPSQLRLSETYVAVYVMWMYLVFMYALPFVILVILNTFIVVEIRRAFAERSRMSRSQLREQKTTLMLVVIVIIFVLFNAPAMSSNLVEALGGEAVELTQVSNLLVVLGSSINIYVYSAMGTRFRKTLVSMLLCRRASDEEEEVRRGQRALAEDHPARVRHAVCGHATELKAAAATASADGIDLKRGRIASLSTNSSSLPGIEVEVAPRGKRVRKSGLQVRLLRECQEQNLRRHLSV